MKKRSSGRDGSFFTGEQNFLKEKMERITMHMSDEKVYKEEEKSEESLR